MDRRQFIVAAGAIATTPLMVGGARAQSGGAGKMIFPFTPGGAGDALARILAEAIQKETGKTMIVENRTGAGGRIGIKAVRDSTPDGTTLLITAFAPMTIYPHFYGAELGYDPFTEFAPVSQPVTFDFALAAATNVPAKNAKELAAWLKADEKRATYGVPAAGTLPHFLGLQFGKAAGVDMQVIAYRGTAPAVNDVVAGQLPMCVVNTSDVAEHYKAGKIRIIGTFTEKPTPFAENVQTMREQGFDIVGAGWYGVFAPAKTPPETVQRLSRLIATTVREPAMRQRLLNMGLDPTGTTPDELAAIQRRDHDFWGPIVKASGFKPTN